jgi:hypothetical protein
MQRLQVPPLPPALAHLSPPLAQLGILAARLKPEEPERAASMSGGGDVLYWERRVRALACVQAQHALSCAKQQADAAEAFVTWYEADYVARVAAVRRAQRRRVCVAARVAAAKARATPLTQGARMAAKRSAELRDAEEAAVRRRLAYPALGPQTAAARQAAATAAAAAVARAMRLVESVQRSEDVGALRRDGEGSGGEGGGDSMTL